jgi:glutathione synthase/RimK-type ligase-like ATP-grasp enzyme
MVLIHANNSDLSANYISEWLLYYNIDFDRFSEVNINNIQFSKYRKIFNRKTYDFLEFNEKCVFSYARGISKLTLLNIASQNGLMCPETVLISKNLRLSVFESKRWVVKPIYEVTTEIKENKKIVDYTTVFDVVDTRLLRSLNPDQYLLQEYIEPKYEVRIYFFNGNFYSLGLAIEKQLENGNCDVRHYASINSVAYERVEIPAFLMMKLSRMLKDLSINFAGIDLIYDGEYYYFLELNQHAQFEHHCKIGNLGVAKKIVESILVN